MCPLSCFVHPGRKGIGKGERGGGVYQCGQAVKVGSKGTMNRDGAAPDVTRGVSCVYILAIKEKIS